MKRNWFAVVAVTALFAASAVFGLRAQDPGSTPPRESPGAALRLHLGGAEGRDVTLFPSRDLVAAIVASQSDPDAAPADAAAAAATLRRTILASVTTFVDPAFVDGEEAKWLGHDHFAVIGRPAQHAWVAAFLKLAKEHAGTLVFLDIQLLRCKPELATELGVPDEPVVFGVEEGAKFRARFERDAGAIRDGIDLLIAPKVLVFPLQQLELTTGDKVSYVKDFELVKLDGDQTIADPVIGVLRTGFAFEGSVAFVGADQLVLNCSMRFADLERPIPERKVDLTPGTGALVTIQVPKLDEVACEAKVILREGNTVLVPSPEFRGTRQFVLIKVQRQDQR